MTDQTSCGSTDLSARDAYAESQVAERLLNEAIVRADIKEGFEEYLAVFDRFYADEIKISSEAAGPDVRGKDAVRSFLALFLIPLHIMAEVGGMSASIRMTPIPADGANETHSAWTLDLIGVSGRTCTLKWRTQRKWKASRVVQEHHYDQQQMGYPLTLDDLNLGQILQ